MQVVLNVKDLVNTLVYIVLIVKKSIAIRLELKRKNAPTSVCIRRYVIVLKYYWDSRHFVCGKPMGVNAIRGARFRVVEVADGG